MVLQVCVNGARSATDHPALPVTSVALAGDVAQSMAAGAQEVHLHVKDRHGEDTFDPHRLADVLIAIRKIIPDVPIGVTTGAWALPDVAERVAAIRAWTVLPDFASVNWHEEGADEVASALSERRIGVEAGLWHHHGTEAWLRSPHRDQCMRIMVELPDGLDAQQTHHEADELLAQVRDGLLGVGASMPLLLHGEGSSCWPALRLAASLGLDTRIGLEDTLYRPDGTLATDNADLVRAARAESAMPV